MHSYKLLLNFNKVLFILFSENAYSIINLNQTRVILPLNKGSTTVTLFNDDEELVLTQLWIDEGNVSSTPETIESPIIIVNPVFQFKKNQNKTVKLFIANKNAFLSDRESLYWFNIYQIPSKQKKSFLNSNDLLVALRTRYKIFVRPESIGSLNYEDLNEQINFNIDQNDLIVTNNTAFYLTLPSIFIGDEELGGTMVPPFSSETLVMKQIHENITTIEYSLIMDNGELITNKYLYNRMPL